MRKKTIIISSLAIIIVGIGAAAFINFSLAERPSADTSLNLSNSKTVANAQKTSDLGFEGYGKITFIAKKIGDSVVAGEVLAKIDDAGVLTQYAQAKAGVSIAQADLEALQNSLKKENLKLKGLNSNDKKIQNKQINSVENNITSQNARILQAQDAAKNASIQLDKTTIKAPFAGIITRQDIELGEVVNPNVSVITITVNNI